MTRSLRPAPGSGRLGSAKVKGGSSAVDRPRGARTRESSSVPRVRASKTKARDREIVRLYRSGLSLGDVGERVELTYERVRQILVAAGVERRPSSREGPSYSPAQLHKAARLWWERRPLEEVARVLGLSTHAAGVAMRREGKRRGPRPKPEHGRRYRYIYYGCRCSKCRAANTADQLRFRRARVERGGCWSCSSPQAPGHTLCERHLEALRVRGRRTVAGRGGPCAGETRREGSGMTPQAKLRRQKSKGVSDGPTARGGTRPPSHSQASGTGSGTKAKARAAHVVMSGDGFLCLRCGERESLVVPALVDAAVRQCVAFEAKHAGCKEPKS